MDFYFLPYVWMVIITFIVFLIWSKLEIISAKVLADYKHQKIVNNCHVSEINRTLQLIRNLKNRRPVIGLKRTPGDPGFDVITESMLTKAFEISDDELDTSSSDSEYLTEDIDNSEPMEEVF